MLPLLSPACCATYADPKKREIYDMYGEEGLKGVPPPGAEGAGPMPGGFSGGG